MVAPRFWRPMADCCVTMSLFAGQVSSGICCTVKPWPSRIAVAALTLCPVTSGTRTLPLDMVTSMASPGATRFPTPGLTASTMFRSASPSSFLVIDPSSRPAASSAFVYSLRESRL